ncbi:unnamed protein product [Ranitomeya imitator]|uniref:Uncharacterized protein n=1 Tax=Ranitomeya imitator TaxID=111125 RepID=A0ABN9M9R3_9NEOB|nr:unnamed protein product [Ranitomeya imitator]
MGNRKGPFPNCPHLAGNKVNKTWHSTLDYISVIKIHSGTNLPAGRFGGRTAHAPAILEDGGAQERRRTDLGRPDYRGLQDVIFKPADKGGKIVVWPKTMYEAEAFRHLKDNNCYKKLIFNPLIKFQSDLLAILQLVREKKIIYKELFTALQINEPTIPTIHLLPKIHRNSTTPPGRPIISEGNNYLENVNKLIDSELKPLVCELPSFVKDTSDFLKKVDGLHQD